jgi:hypothetical protein
LYTQQLDLATAQQWHDLVPSDILREVALQHGGDLADGKLVAPVHFWIMLVGVLSKGPSSLKDLISLTQERFGRVLGWLTSDNAWVSPSALSQRNKKRPVAFWQNIYNRLRQHHFSTGWLRKAWQKKLGIIEAVDSSTFSLMARLRPIFAPSGSGGPKKGSKNRKGALKIHQVYHVGDELPADMAIGAARTHDRKGWKKAVDQARKGVLYLIDRGYCCFKLWRQIEDAQAYFITPLKKGVAYEHLRWLNAKRQRERVRDELVRFPGMDQDGELVILRLVQIRQADGSWWGYVSNLDVEELSPQDIAEIYRLRWRIEIHHPDYRSSDKLGWSRGPPCPGSLFLATTRPVASELSHPDSRRLPMPAPRRTAAAPKNGTPSDRRTWSGSISPRTNSANFTSCSASS